MRAFIVLFSLFLPFGAQVSSMMPVAMQPSQKKELERDDKLIAKEAERQDRLAKEVIRERYRLSNNNSYRLLEFLRAIDDGVPGGLKATRRQYLAEGDLEDPIAEPREMVIVVATRKVQHALAPFVRLTTDSEGSTAESDTEVMYKELAKRRNPGAEIKEVVKEPLQTVKYKIKPVIRKSLEKYLRGISSRIRITHENDLLLIETSTKINTSIKDLLAVIGPD